VERRWVDANSGKMGDPALLSVLPISHMDGSGIEWVFPLNSTVPACEPREACHCQQRARQVIECAVGAVGVDADRVLLSLRFGSGV
jgi:hypothetical protein